MDNLSEFNYYSRHKVELSELEPSLNYCAIAWLDASNQYNYDLVDCDGDTEAYRLCIREPKNCSDSTLSLFFFIE